MNEELLANKKILIVDDHPDSRLLLEVILKKMGGAFDTAVNGKEAVEKVKHGGIDLVLMDVRMPVMNGYEAAIAIREINKEVPIVALTAHVMDWVEGKCLKAGMNDYMMKPFRQEQLVQMLRKWIGKTIDPGPLTRDHRP
ncbi:MAG: response regulator [Candidatus Omnitrophica bacterium]|nr:response regulator [Candidatus Omnitrophota bacterium]